jgi:hypothetical protein
MGPRRGRQTAAGARAGAAVLTLAGLVSVAAFLASDPASAATLGATATITDPTTNTPLTSGGSQTPFTLDLPPSAACSGDTASDGYHVFSYLLAQGTAVTSDTFVGGFPSEGLGLFDPTGYYGSADTAVTTGQVVDIPTNFEFYYLLTHGQTASSIDGGSSETWQAGLACANSSGTVTDYWITPVTFTASTSDPHGFVWTAGLTVPGAPTSPTALQGKKSIAVTWTDPTNNGGSTITGYDVYCSTTSPPSTSGTPSATASGATATSATVTGLTKGATYYCVVTAVNAQGQSAASPVAVKPPDTTKTTVTCKPKKLATAKTATCTAKVADVTTAKDKPTGTVTWSGGTGSFGHPTCTLSAGSCTDTFVPSATGTQTITATFSGNASQASSTGKATLKVT